MTCSWPNVSWQLKPSEILRPSVDVELKFESHIGRQSHKIVLIVRSVNSTDDRVRTHRKRLNLVSALNDEAVGEQAGHFEEVDDVEDDYGPSVHVQVERDLNNKIVLSTDLLV